uniref:Uncharacterized protein n=1 Tax=Rhizophora mucronata TaxID=61149 RepID=A0A2P2QMD4_RHIMU
MGPPSKDCIDWTQNVKSSVFIDTKTGVFKDLSPRLASIASSLELQEAIGLLR